jgi:predicted ATPase/class 3 adenylate cyclase
VVSRDVALALAHDAPVRRDLPSGTVTLLFTDVEGSTRLLHELGAEGYAEALGQHRRLIRNACARHDGVEVDTQGDAFFFAFPTGPGALAAAEEMTGALAPGPIRIRVGLHTGQPLLTDEGYVGGDVHRAARIAAAGHGGQVLVSASTAALLDTDLLDLGEHRLKDLSAPERIFQLGDGKYPALKSLYRTNLPVPSTPFLGRERELEEVVALLSENDARLLTLTGPGGTGKTRLAAQAAGLAADDYRDGVWWVPLASLRDPRLVLETAAQAVGSKNGLAEHIADKSMLLLFDNFEHVVEASPDVASLLAACPQLDVLVTSREPLHVTGEREYAVPPLVHKEGVDFFLARARAVRPDFHEDEAVSKICRRLDDLPLALELAAARVKALSSDQILDRLEERLPLLTGGARDLPERQRTLRATIAWSYNLLTEDEQRLFARLAVFRGGCTLDAAEDAADADLDTLQSLVDKSLLRFNEGRYWMLETIREYGSECLEASGEGEEFRRRHAEHFLALAEEAYPNLTGSPKAWLERLEAEHDNIRAALDRLEAAGETQLVLRLSGALWKFWYQAGYRTEGLHRLERALAADETAAAARALALSGATAIAGEAGDHVQAKYWGDEALALHRQLGDAWGVANSIYLLGNLASEQREWETARGLFEESLEAFRELGDEHYTLLAMGMLAGMHTELGDVDQGRALTEEMLGRARALGNQRVEVFALYLLASHAREARRFDEALSLLDDAYRINRDLGQRSEVAGMISLFARVHAAAGEAVSAVQLLASSDARFDELGQNPPTSIADMNKETLAIAQAELDEGAFTAAWQKGRTLTADAAVALALATRLHG